MRATDRSRFATEGNQILVINMSSPPVTLVNWELLYLAHRWSTIAPGGTHGLHFRHSIYFRWSPAALMGTTI